MPRRVSQSVDVQLHRIILHEIEKWAEYETIMQMKISSDFAYRYNLVWLEPQSHAIYVHSVLDSCKQEVRLSLEVRSDDKGG